MREVREVRDIRDIRDLEITIEQQIYMWIAVEVRTNILCN